MAVLDKTRFREALIERMELTGVTAAALARKTGVSKPQIDKLRQRRSEVTNVYDAVLIARFFGQTVEEFMGIAAKSVTQDEVLGLLAQLPPAMRELIILQLKALVAIRASK